MRGIMKKRTIEEMTYFDSMGIITNEVYEELHGTPLKRWLVGVSGWGKRWADIAQAFREDHWGVC